ncbi:MAG: hypothetical protein FWF98_01025 [Dehalococcoidia bacterium]|nr:hypothetical protein [Dehalococcoidia bacterium]
MKHTKAIFTKLFVSLTMVAILVFSSIVPVTAIPIEEEAWYTQYIAYPESPISSWGFYVPYEIQYYVDGTLQDIYSTEAYFADFFEGFIFCFTPTYLVSYETTGYILYTEIWEFDCNIYDLHWESCSGIPLGYSNCVHTGWTGSAYLGSWSDSVSSSNGYPKQFPADSYDGYSPSTCSIMEVYQYTEPDITKYDAVYISPSYGSLVSFCP